jgi:hypothetical protein
MAINQTIINLLQSVLGGDPMYTNTVVSALEDAQTAVQSSNQGTSGQVLTSNGPDVDPSFQDAGGGSGLPSPIEAEASLTLNSAGPGAFIGNVSDDDQSQQLIMIGSTDTNSVSNDSSELLLLTGDLLNPSSTGNAGVINIKGGNIANAGSGNASTINISGGSVSSGSGQAGRVNISCGNSDQAGGAALSLSAGTSNSANGGNINIMAGSTNSTSGPIGGSVIITTGTDGNGNQNNAIILDGPGQFNYSVYLNVQNYNSSASPLSVGLTIDNVVAISTSSKACTVNLPQGATQGQYYIIKDVDGHAGTNHITVTPYEADHIDGATSYVISSNYGHVALCYNGDSDSWMVVG